MRAIITAGRNSQLRPPTHTKNKHLIPLANKPMLFYAIEHVVSAGIKDIGIVVRDDAKEIQRACGDGSFWGARISYIAQAGEAQGLAHAIKCSREFLQEEPFLLYLGDNIVFDDLNQLKQKFEQDKLNCLLTLARVPNPEKFGVPEFRDGKIVRVEERPIHPKSEFAVAGLYFYDPSAHRALEHIKPSFRGDYEISDVHSWLAKQGYAVGYQEIKGWWKDRGNPRDLLYGNKLLLHAMRPSYDGASIDPGVVIEGNVRIGNNTKIGGRTLIRGPVVIGEYCLIKDSYIGPYTSVGNKVEVHGGDVEHSIVFDDASIITDAKIIDSLIGAGSVIARSDNDHPRGHKVVVGENSSITL